MLWVAALPLPVLYAFLACVGVLSAFLLLSVACFPKAADRIFCLLDGLYRLRYGECTDCSRYHRRSRRHLRCTKKAERAVHE